MLSLWAVIHFTSKCKPRIFAHNSRPARVYLSSPLEAVYSITPEGRLYIFTLFILYTNPFAYSHHATASPFNFPYAVCLVFRHMSHTVSLIFSSLVTVFVPHRDVTVTQTQVFLLVTVGWISHWGSDENVVTRNKSLFEQERNLFLSPFYETTMPSGGSRWYWLL